MRHWLFCGIMGVFLTCCNSNGSNSEPPSDELVGTWQITTDVTTASISQSDENSICDDFSIDTDGDFDFDNFELIVNEDETECTSGTIHSGTSVSSGNTTMINFECEATGNSVTAIIEYFQFIENCEYVFTNTFEIDLNSNTTLSGTFSADLEISGDCEEVTVYQTGTCPFLGTAVGVASNE